jgi:NAD(P)-dependent dehydrogenase (short-subunit alcohol dehydrogenase family)
MNKRVLITGAAGGLGTAAADELRRQGATVVGLDLQATEDWILECDIRDQDSVDRAVAAAIEKLGGGLDVLINNAGVGDPQSSGDAPDEKALAVIDINLVGAWRVTSAALPALRESRGRVVNVASGLAHITAPFSTAYTMAKRGLVGYSDCLRLEHGERISVTTVYPGYIRTAIHDASKEKGMGLEGAVPAETVEDAGRAFARAALSEKPIRDLATTRSGTMNYALVKLAPRGVLDRLTRWQTRRLARKGHFDDSDMTATFAADLKA